MFKEYDIVFNEFIEKINKIKHYNKYKYFLGKNDGLENKSYDDVEGISIEGVNVEELGRSLFGYSEFWLKGRIVIPTEIAGIKIKGSKATITQWISCSCKFYVNGEKKIDDKWWPEIDFSISDSLKGDDVFDITICFKKVNGACYFSLPCILIDKVESTILEIDAFFRTLKFLQKLIDIRNSLI